MVLFTCVTIVIVKAGGIMHSKDLWTGIAILFIGSTIIISSYFIGNAIKSANKVDTIISSVENAVLNLSQASKYMNLSEEEIEGIIRAEKNKLERSGSFHGKMFP